MGTLLSAFVVLSLLLLGGCATPAEPTSMTVQPGAVAASTQNNRFAGAIAIKDVNGGEATNPLWTSEISNAGFREALRQSLANAGLLSQYGTAKYDLHATLVNTDQPFIGLDMTVTTHVSYLLEERKPFHVWYDQSIAAPYTATFSDAPLGFVRLKLANEGSVRENIRMFLEDVTSVEKPVR